MEGKTGETAQKEEGGRPHTLRGLKGTGALGGVGTFLCFGFRPGFFVFVCFVLGLCFVWFPPSLKTCQLVFSCSLRVTTWKRKEGEKTPQNTSSFLTRQQYLSGTGVGRQEGREPKTFSLVGRRFSVQNGVGTFFSGKRRFQQKKQFSEKQGVASSVFS